MSDLMQKFPLAKTNLDNKVTLTFPIKCTDLQYIARHFTTLATNIFKVSFTFNVTHWVES